MEIISSFPSVLARNKVAHFKNPYTLVFKHKISGLLGNRHKKATCIYNPLEDSLTILPLGSSQVKFSGTIKMPLTQVVNEELFPSLYKKNIDRVSFLPRGKTVVYFSNDQPRKKTLILQIICIKCGGIIIDTHTESFSHFITPECKCDG